MPVLRIVTDVAAPKEVCFDLFRSIDLHLESMIASEERAVAGVTTGLICAGQEVSWEARHFGPLWRMTSRIAEFDPPHRFVDEMVRGPFAAFRHEHLFEDNDGRAPRRELADDLVVIYSLSRPRQPHPTAPDWEKILAAV